MDRLVQAFDAVPDGDLMLCTLRGVAYQADMRAGRVSYGDDYLAQKLMAYEGSEIAREVNAGRCAMLARHLAPGATVLDIGAGSGAFVRAALAAGFAAKGFDVIPAVVDRLKDQGLFDDDPIGYQAVTMWDSIEHMEYPGLCLNGVGRGAMLFVSVPLFDDLGRIRESKHYRPGEHLYYWTADGFITWISAYGFRLIARSTHETDAGRDSIGAFAFRRDLPALIQ